MANYYADSLGVAQNLTANAGFFSIDNGNTWAYLPASDKAVCLERANKPILLKRAGSSDVTAIAIADWVDYR